jgi:hypothetical protein
MLNFSPRWHWLTTGSREPEVAWVQSRALNVEKQQAPLILRREEIVRLEKLA